MWRSSHTFSGNSEGGIQVNKEVYFGFTNGATSSIIEVKADVNGDTSGEFHFDLVTENPHEKISNNALKIVPNVPEKGIITIQSQGIEKTVSYEIFPSGVIFGNPFKTKQPVGFDFSSGERVEGTKHDMWMYGDDHYTIHARVGAILDSKPNTFYDNFVEANNLQEYEYEEMSFEPDLGKIYFIECSKGYAVVIFHTSGWGFIYKYSETGIFE